MVFYVIITDAYANEAVVRSDLPDYLNTLWPFVKLKWQTSLERTWRFLCARKQPLCDSAAQPHRSTSLHAPGTFPKGDRSGDLGQAAGSCRPIRRLWKYWLKNAVTCLPK